MKATKEKIQNTKKQTNEETQKLEKEKTRQEIMRRKSSERRSSRFGGKMLTQFRRAGTIKRGSKVQRVSLNPTSPLTNDGVNNIL